jgi:hypothetical protein
VTNSSGKTVSVLLGVGDGTLLPKVDSNTGWHPYFVTIGDFNSDGKPDLAVVNFSSNTVSVLLNSIPSLYTLTVNLAGTGGGSVIGAAQGYSNTSCEKAVSGSCTPAVYLKGTLVTLTATPDWKSAFNGWIGVDSSAGNTAEITLNTNRSVTATLDHINKVNLKPSDTSYASIQDAYKDGTSGGTIQAQDYYFLESVALADSNITEITLSGGMDSSYTTSPGYSTIQGLFVRSGKVNVKNVKIR